MIYGTENPNFQGGMEINGVIFNNAELDMLKVAGFSQADLFRLSTEQLRELSHAMVDLDLIESHESHRLWDKIKDTTANKETTSWVSRVSEPKHEQYDSFTLSA